MSGVVDQRRQRVPHDRAVSWTPATALFWRLFVVNGAVFFAGAAVLVLSPATVSAPVAVTGISSVLAVGLIVLLVVIGFLLRGSLRPLSLCQPGSAGDDQGLDVWTRTVARLGLERILWRTFQLFSCALARSQGPRWRA
jgi:hypothetical protein